MRPENIIMAIILLGSGYVIGRLISKYLARLLKRKEMLKVLTRLGYAEPVIDFLSFLIRFFIYLFFILLAVSQFGFANQVLTLFAVVLFFSVFGILLYSLRDFIPCAFAGAYIINNKLLKPGDKLVINSHEGVVKDVKLLTTTIKDKKGHIIIIPNSLITRKILEKKER